MTTTRLKETSTFLMRPARALHAYGTPSHRLEEALEIMSAEPGEMNLDKLTSLNEVMQRVEGGEIDVRQGLAEIEGVVSGPLRYRPGWTITEAVFGRQPPVEPLALPGAAFLVAAPLAAASFTVLFRARPADYLWILLGCSVAFQTARHAGGAFGPELGAALGAWVLGCLSNLLARWRGKPSSITLVPGLLILVPGSFGFRSLEALVHNDVLAGVETGFSMALIAMSLVTGLFLSNLTVAPRRLL